jgi:lipid-A-disaccharide synthase
MVDREAISSAFSGLKPILVEGRAAEVVGASDAAVVASGTAALEAGLMERPMVVVYRVAPLSYAVGRALIRLPHVSLVNLLLGREVVPELLQGEMSRERIAAEVRRLWREGPDREAMIDSLRGLRKVLGPAGAAKRAAQEVLSFVLG